MGPNSGGHRALDFALRVAAEPHDFLSEEFYVLWIFAERLKGNTRRIVTPNPTKSSGSPRQERSKGLKGAARPTHFREEASRRDRRSDEKKKVTRFPGDNYYVLYIRTE